MAHRPLHEAGKTAAMSPDAIIFSEMLLVLVLVLGFGFRELWKLKKDKEK